MAEKTTRAPKRNFVSFTKPENFEYVSEFVKILLAVVSKKNANLVVYHYQSELFHASTWSMVI